VTKWELPDDELKQLDTLALRTITYLVVCALGSFAAGVYILNGSQPVTIFALALLGFSGSAVAALTSCLDRYANGFERDGGVKYPSVGEKDKETGKERFSRRFSWWLIVRPFLGLLIAPIFIWGISYFAEKPDKFRSSVERSGFTAFMAGLLAKSVIDLIKGLFKNIFHV